MRTLVKKRFSLIELLVVISIIAALASMLLPAVSKANSKAKYARWLGHKRNLMADTDVLAFYTFEEGSGATLSNLATGPDYDGSYIQSNYDGAIRGAVWTAGRWTAKPALDFDGINDAVDVGTWNIGTAEYPSDELTIAAWFYADSFPNDPRIISKADGTSTTDHWFAMAIDNGPDRLWLRLKTETVATKQVATDPPAGVISTDVWTFAAVTFDGSTVVLYINGQQMKSDAAATSGTVARDSGINVRIGGNPVGARWFDGLIDEVAVFRRALTPSEIGDYYSSGSP